MKKLLAALFAFAPVAALACPACAGRNDGGGNLKLYLMGSMILLPFGIAAVVHKVILQAEKEP